jgi:glycosyltransferase involved in cell wall biosynthesis
MKISVVSPVYKAEKMVEELVNRILALRIPGVSDIEIVLVEDGSPDRSWDEIVQLAAVHKEIKGIQLSRNFGQHYAITAGLRHCSGDWIVVMDCDLQDRPEEIYTLLSKAHEGWDIVFARREFRQDGFFKNGSSKLFHSVYKILSGHKSDHSVANFGVFSSQVINEFNKMNEGSRSFPALVQHLGFKKTSIHVEHGNRFEGKSSYSFSKLLRLAFDVIISNSNRPLWIAVALGLIMSVFSFLLAAYNLIAKYLELIHVAGYTSTIFSIWFVGGINLFVLGIIGIYLGKVYDESKGRPFFIIKETVNLEGR